MRIRYPKPFANPEYFANFSSNFCRWSRALLSRKSLAKRNKRSAFRALVFDHTLLTDDSYASIMYLHNENASESQKQAWPNKLQKSPHCTGKHEMISMRSHDFT